MKQPKCGCILNINCPLHDAAHEMIEALEAFDEYTRTNFPANLRLKQIAVEKMEHALAKAKGEVND